MKKKVIIGLLVSVVLLLSVSLSWAGKTLIVINDKTTNDLMSSFCNNSNCTSFTNIMNAPLTVAGLAQPVLKPTNTGWTIFAENTSGVLYVGTFNTSGVFQYDWTMISGLGGSSNHDALVMSDAPPPAAPTCTLTATPSTVAATGASVLLNWTITSATAGTFNIAPSAAGTAVTTAIGSVTTDLITSNKIYVLTVSNETGTATCQAAVTVSQPCTYSLSPVSTAVGSSGGTGSVTVTAGSGCTWTATSNASWITVTAGSTGSGNGAVSYQVDANSGVDRTGTITIGGQTFTVAQQAPPPANCTYSLSPVSTAVGSSGGTGSVTVTVTVVAGCTWTATSNASWITVTAGSTGSGNGAVSYQVGANSGSARTGTITIGGQTFTVSQSAAGGGGTGTETQLPTQFTCANQTISPNSVRNFYFLVPATVTFITGQIQSVDLASDVDIFMSDTGYVTYEQAQGITGSTNKNASNPPWYGRTGSSNEKVTIAKTFTAGQKIYLSAYNKLGSSALICVQWY